MFQDKYVFAQLASFLNWSKFNRIVAKYDSNKYVKHFTCWNQLLALMFSQLSNRESLRDLIVALEAHHSKCYHLGMGKTYQNHRWHEQIKIETIISLKNTFTTLLVKHDKSVLITFSNLAVTLMFSTRQLLTCVFLFFDRLNSARRKGVSRCIHYIM